MLIEIPARRGKAARLRRGQTVRVINTTGQQVVDTWAFRADDIAEFMSMEHSRVAIGRIIPGIGDTLVTNRRRPILTLAADTSGGIRPDELCRRRQLREDANGGEVLHHRAGGALPGRRGEAARRP